MKEWEAVTAYRFVPYTPTVHAEYGLGHNTTLIYVQGDGCWSFVGRLNANIQKLSPCGGAAAAHEMGHTFGLFHEQQNENRDSYVRINWDNIKPSYRNFFMISSGKDMYPFHYDLNSIMHYGLWDFNSNGQPVMTVYDNRLVYLVNEKYKTDYFYPAYEVQLALKLNETICKNFTLKCHNAGYLSYVDGKCQCRCPFALNSEDGCQTLESKGCGGIYNMTFGMPSTVQSPRNYNNSTRCTWMFKSPAGTKLRLNFNNLDIKTTAAGSCEDMLEIRHTLPGHRGFKICGNGYSETIITEFNYLFLTLFSSSGSAATGFSATVDVINDNMLNYVNQGLDGTYSGTVSVTRGFDLCIPWADVIGKCPHHPMEIGDVPDNLEENYCRNPGSGTRPWCYTTVDQCLRDYCDVSFLERCIDVWTDCSKRISRDSEFCTKYGQGVAWKCAKTCGKCETRGPVKLASTVTCRPPNKLNDGDYMPQKASYAVGDTVNYKCTKGNDEIKITCNSEGNWIPKVSFVCGAHTSTGWIRFQGNFYQYFDFSRTFQEAETHCNSLKASISTAKSKDENDFIGSLVPSGKAIWLGMSDAEKEGVWKWIDSTLVSWFNWKRGQPDNWKNDEDHVIMIYLDKKWSDVKETAGYPFVCKRHFDERRVCADQDSNCMKLIAKIPDMRPKYPVFASERCPKTTGLCTDKDITGQTPCNSNTPSDACAVCLDPGAVAYANKVKGGDTITVGETFEYICNDGYISTKGNLIRACLPSGTLTGETPICQDLKLVPTKVNNVSTRQRSNVMSPKTVYTGNNAYHRISKSGEIYEWELDSDGNVKIALQVWRPTETGFTFVGQNIVDQAQDERLRNIIIPTGSRIAVKPNDLIGFYYVGVSKGGVTFDGCNEKVEPEGMNQLSSSSKFPDASSFSVNQTIQFKSETSCRIFSLNAVVGPKLLK